MFCSFPFVGLGSSADFRQSSNNNSPLFLPGGSGESWSVPLSSSSSDHRREGTPAPSPHNLVSHLFRKQVHFKSRGQEIPSSSRSCGGQQGSSCEQRRRRRRRHQRRRRRGRDSTTRAAIFGDVCVSGAGGGGGGLSVKLVNVRRQQEHTPFSEVGICKNKKLA